MNDNPNLAVNTCSVHLLPSEKYCPKCSRLVCPKCKEIEGHKLTRVKDLIAAPEWGIKAESVPKYKEEAAVRKVNLVDEAAGRLRDIEELNDTLTYLDDLIKKKTTIYGHELLLINKITECIKGAQLEAETQTLKHACGEAVKCFSIEATIEAEQREHEDSLVRVKERQERLKVMYNKAKINLARTAIVQSISNPDKMTQEEQLALLLLREDGIVTGQIFCVNCGLENFRAFSGVQRLGEVQEALKAELTDVGCGVKVGKPIVLNKFKRLGGSFGSVSHTGVVAIYNRGGQLLRPGCAGEVEFVDLVKGKNCKIQVEEDTSVAFHDTKMIFITRGFSLREGDVEETFNNPGEAKLTNLKTIVCNSALLDVSLVQSTRLLYYTTAHCKACAYNVDTRENKRVFRFGDIVFFTRMTGLSSLGLGGFLDYHYTGETEYKTYVFVFNKHNSKQKVGMCMTQESCCTILPSTSKPTKQKNALMFFKDSGFRINNTNIDGDKVAHISKWFPVIRMYKDVFLCFNEMLKKYTLVKIVVP